MLGGFFLLVEGEERGNGGGRNLQADPEMPVSSARR